MCSDFCDVLLTWFSEEGRSHLVHNRLKCSEKAESKISWHGNDNLFTFCTHLLLSRLKTAPAPPPPKGMNLCFHQYCPKEKLGVRLSNSHPSLQTLFSSPTLGFPNSLQGTGALRCRGCLLWGWGRSPTSAMYITRIDSLPHQGAAQSLSSI